MSEEVVAPPEQPKGRELLKDPDAWALSPYLARKDRFAVFIAHDFQPDRLSAWVVERNAFEETFSASFRVKNDLDLPGDVLDAVKHNHTPQFTLRNIGRVERNDVDPTDPLPLQRTTRTHSDADQLVTEARNPRAPKVEPVEIWSERMMATVRTSFRRLLMEDPWEWRFGAEVKANFGGPLYNFIVEGTHPDDLPEAWWGPDLIPVPETWAQPPQGSAGTERALTLHDVIRRAEAQSGDG
ncbi:MAG: hypothetical protein RIT45_956 [Pseudomonadota bacterium]|jgi:hypothetical protein